ncbi:hypothetical protein HHK36_006940 [Tetracentron sinense]|uniref:UDP-N-acetylmuramate dehydrogenase n=1 Tax=Tetracentron sinense TaxID=13715 RepID=A0A834ZI25_TETSI|nr:hypothetical protein HHK36_006940 [Tetracentron sinense]
MALRLPETLPFHYLSPISYRLQQSRRNTNPVSGTRIHCISNEELEQSRRGLNFVRDKKLLRDLSTWGIGGPCSYFVEVFEQTQLVSAIRYCCDHSIRFIIVGNGSNCLFDDYGFDGCVILNRINFLERIEPGFYRAGSGYLFNRLGVQCSNEGFTGLEFAGGIPGTVGGAVYMNAGANGQESADAIDSIEIVTAGGKFRTLKRADLSFGYRLSPFRNMEDMAAIVAVTFRLGHSALSKGRLQAYLGRRRISQPVGERNAGSVFKNPLELGLTAGELIEKVGLKGFRVGGAMVSSIHANFFINSGGSTSADMLELIHLVKEKVYQKFGIQLKEEILYVHPNHNGSIQTENQPVM